MRPACSAPTDTPAPAAARRRPARARPPALLAAALLIVGGLGRLVAAPVVPAPEAFTATDSQLTLAVLRALVEDDQLAALNVGVTVHDNIATLWGPIGSVVLALRAEEVVRQVPGIARVVNEMDVLPPEELPPPARRSPVVRPNRPAPERVAGTGASDAGLAGRPTSRGPAPGSDLGWQLPERLHPSPNPALPARRPAAGSVPELPALVIRAPQPPPAGPPPARLVTAPARPRPPDPIVGLEPLLRGDVRYRDLRADARAGDVSLHGVAYSLADLHALARVIGQLPGVRRVILDDVQVVGGYRR